MKHLIFLGVLLSLSLSAQTNSKSKLIEHALDLDKQSGISHHYMVIYPVPGEPEARLRFSFAENNLYHLKNHDVLEVQLGKYYGYVVKKVGNAKKPISIISPKKITFIAGWKKHFHRYQIGTKDTLEKLFHALRERRLGKTNRQTLEKALTEFDYKNAIEYARGLNKDGQILTSYKQSVKNLHKELNDFFSEGDETTQDDAVDVLAGDEDDLTFEEFLKLEKKLNELIQLRNNYNKNNLLEQDESFGRLMAVYDYSNMDVLGSNKYKKTNIIQTFTGNIKVHDHLLVICCAPKPEAKNFERLFQFSMTDLKDKSGNIYIVKGTVAQQGAKAIKNYVVNVIGQKAISPSIKQKLSVITKHLITFFNGGDQDKLHLNIGEYLNQ